MLIVHAILAIIKYFLKRNGYIKEDINYNNSAPLDVYNQIIERPAFLNNQQFVDLKPEQRLDNILKYMTNYKSNEFDLDRKKKSFQLAGLIESESLTEENIVKNYDRIISLLWQFNSLLDMQHNDVNTDSWRYKETYSDLSYDIKSFLTILSLAPKNQVQPILDGFLDSSDPDLVCVAAISIMKLGVEVPQNIIIKLAETVLTRNKFIEKIDLLGRSEMIPVKYRTSIAHAESTFVNSLKNEDNFRSFPDEIELEEKIVLKRDNGEFDYFVFRYRTNPPHCASIDGWLLGVAGSYPHNEAPNKYSGYEVLFLGKRGSITTEEIIDRINLIIHGYI